MFKVEQEGDGLTDAAMEEWGSWVDTQLEKRFGSIADCPALTLSTLNLARNDIGDEGIKAVVEYLRSREINVYMCKLFKNNIGDAGARAIGHLLATARDPVHEVHLSHNHITDQGVCSMFEAVANSGRYPFSAEKNWKDNTGTTTIPVWLRLENNCIQWSTIETQLEQQQVRWVAAEAKDSWSLKENSPMICVHSSYRNQKVEETTPPPPPPPKSRTNSGHSAGFKSEASSGGILSTPVSAQASPEQTPGVDSLADDEGPLDNVPLYAFLDASAVRRFAAERQNQKERLFTFQGLLNLCQQGHMKCVQPEDRQSPAWVGPLEEQDRLIFVVTDAVLDELSRVAEHSVPDRRQIEWLRFAPDSYLQTCHQWGILEVLETKLHSQLVKLGACEERAREMQISRTTLLNFDFAVLWESQIDARGRVVFVTGDDALCNFVYECGSADENLRRVATVHVHALDRTFAADREHGGHRLYEAAQKVKANKYCGAVLSSQVMDTLIVVPTLEGRQLGGGGGGDGREEAFKLGLREALTLLTDVRPLLTVDSPKSNPAEINRFLERSEEAQKRWQVLLGRKS